MHPCSVALITLALVKCHALTPKRVLVVGGSGRVGASTVRWIDRLATEQLPVELAIGGRRRASFDAAAYADAAYAAARAPPAASFDDAEPAEAPKILSGGLSRWRIPCCTVAYGCRTIDCNQLRAYCMVSQHAGPGKSDFRISGKSWIFIGFP